VRNYHDRLCCSLRPICGTIEDTQDAAQEALLRAFVKLDTFTGSSAFYTWLYRIAVNVAISGRRRRAHCSLDDSVELKARSERSDERLLREERARQVQEALQSLTAEHRTMLVLRELDHWDYEEIADILRMPVGTVRSRLHRARLELRARLSSVNDH
jgi:RNA polymerase sigma-70 factor (ECF subfamily)